MLDAGELIETWQAPIYNYACRWLRDAAEAEDATQEIFIEVLRDRHQIRSAAALKAWIYRVASRVLLRQKKRRERALPRATSAGLGEVSAPSQRPLELAERRSLVESELAALPEGLRSALVLKYFQGLTQHEVAAALDLPRSTVQSRIKKGLDLLKGSVRLAGTAMAAPELEALLASSPGLPVPSSLSSSLLALSTEASIPAGVLVGGVVLKTKLKVGALVLVLGLIAFVGLTSLREAPREPRKRLAASTEPAVEEAAVGEAAPTSLAQPGSAPAGPARTEPAQGESAQARAAPAPGSSAGPSSSAETAPETHEGEEGAKASGGLGQGSEAQSPKTSKGMWMTVLEEATGAPVKGVVVYLESSKGGAMAHTDAQGRAFVEDIVPGTWALGFNADGIIGAAPEGGEFSSSSAIKISVTEKHLAKGFKLFLYRGCSLAGRVLDSAGSPIDARVLLVRQNNSIAAKARCKGGEYRFKRVAPGSFRLVAEHPDFVTASVEVVLEETAPERRVDLTFESSLSLSGRVLGPDSAPVEGARVEVMPASKDGPFLKSGRNDKHGGKRSSARSDAAGYFVLKGLSSEPLDLIVSAPGFRAELRRGLIVGAETGPLELRLVPGGTISVRIVDLQGKPVAACTVLYGRPGQPRVWAGKTSADGRFKIEGLPDASYRLRCEPEEHCYKLLEGIRPRAEEMEIVVEPRLLVVGRVTTPPGGAKVTLLWCLYTEESGMAELARVDQEGRFSVRLPTPRVTSLEFKTEGYSPYAIQGLKVEAGAPVEVEVPLKIGARISGKVVDATGAPCKKIEVNWHRAGDTRVGRFSSTDHRGDFRLENLPSGEVTIVTIREDAQGRKRQVQTQLTLNDGDDRRGLVITHPLD